MSLGTVRVRRSFATAMMVLGATLTFGQNARDLVNGKVGAGVLRFRTVNKLAVIK